jgi:preprotein translocase subunit Sec61beta
VAQKQKGPGIQSAAGLIRYFDAEEDSSVKIKPSYVLVFSAIVGILAIMMRIYWKIN